MNIKMIIYVLSRMIGVEALVLLVPALVSTIYGENAFAFLITAVGLMLLAVILGRKKPQNSVIYGKEGFVIIASAWILWSVFGAIPFYISHSIPNFVDAVFETVSGFTTTGSTILTDISAMPKGMNFWRCLTHWIGGMGVLVFVMLIVSLEDKNSMHLIRAEVPGPEKDKLVPRARQSAKILYGMYFMLTLIEIIMLRFGGMNWYDSIIHSFSTAGTGGFNNRNNSVAYYEKNMPDKLFGVPVLTEVFEDWKQEKAEKERIKTEERAEKERQAKERALLKLESLEVKFETNMQQVQEIFEYLQSKEEFMLKYCNDFQWVVEQVREKGAEKTSKPLQALVKKCDTLAKKLDTINNTLIQLMTIKDKYSTNVPMETGEWQEVYRQLMTFSNTIKTNLLKIIDCIEQIEQKILLEE